MARTAPGEPVPGEPVPGEPVPGEPVPGEPVPGGAARQEAAVPPWRDRRFLVFAAGNFANNLGEAAYKVGLPLYVYALTGSLTTMSLLAALAAAMLLLSPWLGAVVDRWGSRVFVVPGLLVQLGAAVALNVSLTAGYSSPVPLFVCAALIQIGGEMYRSGWIAGVPGMFPRNAAHSRAVLSSLFVTSNVAGPLLVAVGIGLVGYLGLLWFNAVTFLAPIAVWLLGVHPPAKERGGKERSAMERSAMERGAKDGQAAAVRPGLRADIVEGWRIVRAEKRVLRLELAAVPLHFVSGVGVASFMVWFLRDHWQLAASGVSTVQAVANCGALGGSLLIAARARARPRVVLAASAAVMTLCLFGMALPSPWAFMGCMVVFFTVRSAMTTVTATVIVKYLPAEVVGRAEGLFNLVGGVPILLAPLLIPLVQGEFGASAVPLFLGAVATLSLVCLVRFWQDWQAPDAES